MNESSEEIWTHSRAGTQGQEVGNRKLTFIDRFHHLVQSTMSVTNYFHMFHQEPPGVSGQTSNPGGNQEVPGRSEVSDVMTHASCGH